MRKKHLSCTWALLLKLHLATFSHWERSFSASLALHSLHLLSCTKHIISVFRSSKLVILCIEALTWLALQKSSNTSKSVFYIANNISFHERNISCTWALLLKLHLATFSHWERSFSASLALHSLHCLVALNTALVFLALTALVFLALKKSSKHENLSSALQITFHFMRKKHLSCTWALTLKIAFSNFLSLRKKLFSILGLAFSSFA